MTALLAATLREPILRPASQARRLPHPELVRSLIQRRRTPSHLTALYSACRASYILPLPIRPIPETNTAKANRNTPPHLPFLLKTCARTLRFFCQGSSLRSDERKTRAALTARTAGRLRPPGRAFVLYAPLRGASEGQRPKT